MWLGKSWWDIEVNYGVHLWHWDAMPVPRLFSKDVVREIDTSFFCAIRKLFDDFGGDGYISTPVKEDRNCLVVWMETLVPHAQGLLASYDFSEDSSDAKWVDTSGNHLHGWAPNGTAIIHQPDESVERHFSAGSYAVLPVPADYDARVGTIHIGIRFDGHEWASNVQLAKLRIEGHRELLISVVRDAQPEVVRVRFQWIAPGLFRGWREGVDWNSDRYVQ